MQLHSLCGTNHPASFLLKHLEGLVQKAHFSLFCMKEFILKTFLRIRVGF